YTAAWWGRTGGAGTTTRTLEHAAYTTPALASAEWKRMFFGTCTVLHRINWQPWRE
ncbi:unnamed protein product, partial [Closterium sp. Yama58-4]